DRVLRGLVQRDVRRDGARLEEARAEYVGEIRGDEPGAGDFQEAPAAEAGAERESARLAAGRALDGAFRKSRFAHVFPQSKRNSSELRSAHCRSSVFCGMALVPPLFR